MSNIRKYLGTGVPVMVRVVAGIWLSCALAWGQLVTSTWQEDIRKYVEAQDWTAAMSIVDREVARAPRDMDVRAWRAKILMWSGKLAEAELEYHGILTAVPNDPDDWLGLATVYSREGRAREALQVLDHAVALDPSRANLLLAPAGPFPQLGPHQDPSS